MRRSREKGFALIGVLWALAILAVVAASISATGHTQARLAHNARELAELRALADGAINATVLKLIDNRPGARPPLDGTPFDIALGGKTLSVAVQDEAGLIDVNMASRDLLVAALGTTGCNADTAAALADAIIEWRAASPGQRLDGAKTEAYRAAGLPYGPRQGPFESVAELRAVKGMTTAIYARLAPLITVYAQSDRVAAEVAPAAVLQALPSSYEARVTAVLSAREALAASPESAPAATSLTGHAVRITAIVGGREGTAFMRTATLRLFGLLTKPVWVYHWQ